MLDENTKAIIAMSWARACGLPDDSFVSTDSTRLLAPADTGVIMVVQLLDRTLLHGPSWALEGAEAYADEGLLEVHGLLSLAKEHRPRATRVAALMYADDYLADRSLHDVRVTDDPQELRDLLARCAPDDVDQGDLSGREHLFVLLDDNDSPRAAAGYSAQHGIIADMVLVSAIDARGSGAVEAAAAVAMHDALDAGLIPQLRVGVDASRDLATSLGFDQLGTLATVAVDS